LQNQSYHVDQAPGVTEALFLMKLNNYDIIITDKNMPGKNNYEEGGLQVLKSAKEIIPSAEVIIMTAYANLDSAIEAMRAGASDYIMKPFELDELNKKIRRIVEFNGYTVMDNAVKLYKELFNAIVKIAKTDEKASEKELHDSIKSILDKISPFFKLRKETDRAFQRISENLDILKQRIGRENPAYGYILNIRKELDKQLPSVRKNIAELVN
ncbi:response regulator, partial [Calditrichota bacterium]